MHLDDRNRHRAERVGKGEARVRERRGVQEAAVRFVHRDRQPIDERALVIRLEAGDVQIQLAPIATSRLSIEPSAFLP